MKKALSIILCLAMLMSTVPMAVFAAPATVTTSDSALEVEEKAELAEEAVFTIKFAAGYRSELISGKSDYPDRTVNSGESFTVPKFNKPATRYQSSVAGYVLDGNWTDGINIYAPEESFVPAGDVTLTPVVVPDGDAFEVTFSIDEVLADNYSGPAKVAVLVGENYDVTGDMFALTSSVGFTALGWKNKATGEIVTSVTGAKDEVIELVAAFEQKTGIVVDGPAKVEEFVAVNAAVSYDGLSGGLKVVPSSADPAVVISGFALDTAEFSTVEVTYVKNDALEYAAGGEVYFAFAGDSEIDLANVATGELKSQNGDLVVYSYDLSANAAWNGTCSTLRIDPYNDVEEVVITEVHFIKNEPVTAVEITGLAAPVISEVPDEEAEIPAEAQYAIESITWTPEAEYFMGSTEYTVEIVVKAADGRIFTDDTTFTLNGEAVADVEATSKSATITKKYAATAAPSDVVITLTSASEITENDGTLELAATIAAENGTDVILPDTLTWSITGGEPNAEIATLDGNVLKAKFNGTIKVTATPAYDVTQAKEFDIAISGQTAFAVAYDKNTGAEVANMPEDEMVKGAYTLPSVTPTRDGYYFEGWMTVPEDGAVVSGNYAVTEDVTFYAKWSKGGYFNSFDSDEIVVNSPSSVTLADNNTLSTDLRYTQGYVANTEEGYVSMVLGGSLENHNDHRLDFNVAASNSQTIDVSKSDEIILGIRSDISGTLNFLIRYTTKDADGNWIAEENNGQAAAANNPYLGNTIYSSVALTGDVNTVTEVRFDMSKVAVWDGFLQHIRFANNNNDNYVGKTIYYDYIKIPGAETAEHIALDIEAPVAAEVSYGTEAVTVGANKYIVTGVEWIGSELLGGMYFDSAKAYTAKVEIEAAGAYALSEAPATVTVNGEKATFVVEDGKYFVTYTFPATEDIGTLELVDITLHEANDDGAATETRQVFKSRDVDLGLIAPANLPAGQRWLGWSATEGGEAIEGTINIEVPTDYYALYEVIESYDFSVKAHQNIANVKATDGLVSFDGNWAVVAPKSDDSNAALTLDGMYLTSAAFDYVEVIYDGSLEDAENENKFGTAAVSPALKVNGEGSESCNGVLVSVEPVIASNRVSYKYTYDISAGKPAVITSLELAPYKGNPAWAVTSVKLVPNEDIENAVSITGITAPATWGTPDVDASASENYEIVSVSWNGDKELYNGTFSPEGTYTVTVVVKPATGYNIAVEDAKIDGSSVDSAVIGGDGLLTVTKEYPKTEALVEFDLTIADAEISEPDASVQLVATFTPEIANKALVWEIVDHGGDREIAEIDENTGLVKAFYDGTIIVKATSVYNPAKSAQATVTLSNQKEYYIVKFDKNTVSENVTGVPADTQAKREYKLPTAAPVREGFIFVGWTKSPTSDVIVENDVVLGDTTYYAKWSKDGYVNSFNSEGNTLASATKVSFADGGYFGTDARYMSDLTVNTEEGYVSTKLGGTAGHYGDYRMNLYVPAGKVDISNIKGFVIGVRSDTAGSMPFFIRYATKDAYGSWIGPDEATNVQTYIANSFWTDAVTFSGDVNEVEELYVDMSDKAAWDGFLDHVRFCINNHSSMLGATIYFDYFRAINEENSVIEIKDVVAPVAKASYSTNATSKEPSKYSITNVEWEGELLYDYYFAGSTEYTVCVTVKGGSGYFLTDTPSKVTINGKTAEVGEYNSETGELTIKYTFPATGVLESSDAYDLTLYGKDDNGEYVEETRTIFDGDKFALGTYKPVSVPAGKRWVGWSEDADATSNTAGETVTVTGDATYYAVYEDLVEFDYSNYYHQFGTTAKGGTLTFDDGLAIVTPATSTSDASVITPAMNIDGTDFGKVEVYYNAMIEATHNNVYYENIFSATLRPVLKFSLTSAPEAFAYSSKPVNSERVLINNNLFQKYTYDMSALGAWAGNIAKLLVDPYNGFPMWGLGLIRLVPSEEITDTAAIEIEAPEAWNTPKTEAAINNKYEIVSVAWTPAAETFAAETEYSLAVTYKPLAEYKVVEAVATVNGEEASVVDNNNGTFTASYTFPATDALKETEVVITGPEAITSTGRYIQLKGTTVATDGSKLPVNGVTWSVESVGTDVALAKVSDNGRVYPISNGTVIVTATSVYDPAVSATHEVVITNQADLVKVTFDKNTQAEVTDMPEDVYVYGAFVPEDYAVKRNGFYLTGWSTDPDAIEPSESFNITEDTVLYAKWGKGYELNFNDAANAAVPRGANTITFANGIGTLSYKNTTSSAGQAFHIEGLKAYELDATVYNTVEIRLSSSIKSSFVIFFRGSDGVSDEGYAAGVYQYNTGVGMSQKTDGSFETLKIDFSQRSAWTEKPFLNKIRFDITPHGTAGEVLIDYIRIPNYNRTVRFEGNGGLIPAFGGEVASYKQAYKIGEITLPANPTKDGYDFLGWAKATEDYDKLYNKKFTVTDDVTLYAIWGPEGSAGSGESGEDTFSPSTEVSASKGDQTTQHPGHFTYPTLEGGTITENPSKTTKTPTDKTVSVPARPKDDGPLAMGAGNILPEKFKKTTTYDGRFTDIKRSNWFYNDVDTSFELGLMNGKSAYEFAPDGTVTLAEAITVAARMNAIYYGRAVYGGTGAQWYVPYVEYAIANSIIKAGEYSDYKAPATREQVAMIFVKALPGSWYPKKNMFSKIPDIAKGSASEETLLKLYNAGIVTGVDDSYNFKPEENIKRSELSAIINRVALPDSRLRVVTEEEKLLRNKVFTAEDILENDSIVTRNSVDVKFKNKNGLAWAEPSKADPWIGGLEKLFEDGFVNADEFKIITVVLKPDDPAAVAGAGGSKFYFAFDGKYTDAISVATAVPAANEDGTITLVYDMTKHAMWAGEVTTLRYDPYDNATPYSIVSITFAPMD